MAVDSKKIHKHLESISRINTGLAAAGLVGVLALFVWLKLSPPAQTETATPSGSPAQPVAEDQRQAQPAVPIDGVDQVQLNQEYRTAVNGLLGGYDFSDATQAETLSFQLIELMVPAEFKSLQLELVIALDEASEGRSTEARARIDRLRQQHPWLLPDFAG
jgi:hypothetical protein